MIMNIQNQAIEAGTRRNFERALRQASWRHFSHLLRRGCDELVPGGLVLGQLSLEEMRDLGVRNVPLGKIVGSVGRYRDFDLSFLPRHDRLAGRWMNIAANGTPDKDLPPVLLYKIGEVFLVEDGNHRISVARWFGEQEIRAHVIEIDPSSLTPDSKCSRLGYRLMDGNNSCSGRGD